MSARVSLEKVDQIRENGAAPSEPSKASLSLQVPEDRTVKRGLKVEQIAGQI